MTAADPAGGGDAARDAPASLPEVHGFRHVLGAEDAGAVARQYPSVPAGDGRILVRTVYHNGRSSSLQTQGAEFEFQLDGQYRVLAQIPAQDYLKARDLFRQRGRQGDSATRLARNDLRKKLIDYGIKRLRMSPGRASGWAGKALRQVAILHNPDQVLGGNLEPSRDPVGTPIPGDARVNSSLGAQNLTNAAVIDAAAHRQVAEGRGHLPLGFQVVLTNRRRNIKRLLARQPSPAREAAPPRKDRQQGVSVRAGSTPVTPRPPPKRPVTVAEDIRVRLGIGPPSYRDAGAKFVASQRLPAFGGRVRGQKTVEDVVRDINGRTSKRGDSTPQVNAQDRSRRHKRTH
ncbi:polymorphic toxin type 15 domain-containing protein [Actinomyces ruminis]|uniref:polymorphic toxin type 15 domain-containing protein n=1 Tax=Actinomyces ruminis TaxID=1937003 RepID=UPI0015D4A76C